VRSPQKPCQSLALSAIKDEESKVWLFTKLDGLIGGQTRSDWRTQASAPLSKRCWLGSVMPIWVGDWLRNEFQALEKAKQNNELIEVDCDAEEKVSNS
jgi:hypothetical protein